MGSRSDDESSLSSLGDPNDTQEDDFEYDPLAECILCLPKQGPASWPRWKTMDQIQWIECNSCKQWAHMICAGLGNSPIMLKRIANFNCSQCVTRHSQQYPDETPLEALRYHVACSSQPHRKSSRNVTGSHISYSNLNSGMGHDPEKWPKYLASKQYGPHKFDTMSPADINLDWVLSDSQCFKDPIVIMPNFQTVLPSDDSEAYQSPSAHDILQTPEMTADSSLPNGSAGCIINQSVAELGMRMPSCSITVGDIAEVVGEDLRVEVIDVASQAETGNWNMAKWANYYMHPYRDSIRNVISLEISDSKMMDYVERPTLVRELDWIEQAWPAARKAIGEYPKVQMYCLMGVGKSYTDWHIDFAGSSVFYHILKGSKVFWFIAPTQANLLAYEKWSNAENQEETWLGDFVSEVQEVRLTAGMTMMIPSGWIHCVYTPDDTIVIGGNFIHGLNIDTQFAVFDIEERTNVLAKHRFPYFWELCWLIAERARNTLMRGSLAEGSLEDTKEMNDPFTKITRSKRGKENLRILVLRLTNEIGNAKSLAPRQLAKSIRVIWDHFSSASMSANIKDYLSRHVEPPVAEKRSMATKGLPKHATFDGLALISDLATVLAQDMHACGKDPLPFLAEIIAILISKIDRDHITYQTIRKKLDTVRPEKINGSTPIAKRKRQSMSNGKEALWQKTNSPTKSEIVCAHIRDQLNDLSYDEDRISPEYIFVKTSVEDRGLEEKDGTKYKVKEVTITLLERCVPDEKT